MPQNKKPIKKLELSPEQRLVNLQAQLSQLELLKQLVEHQGYSELIKLMSAEANRRRKGRDAIHWNSSAAEFAAYEKKSLYAGGYIQGVEFGKNVLEAIPQQYTAMKEAVESLGKEIKAAKKRAK